MDTRLLALLVCPVCKGPLEHWRPPTRKLHELVCQSDRLAFPVRDGIPVMLESAARALQAQEHAGSVEATDPGSQAVTGI
jgi:uncharacterized protein YbaR (Trm112 family)